MFSAGLAVALVRLTASAVSRTGAAVGFAENDVEGAYTLFVFKERMMYRNKRVFVYCSAQHFLI